MKRAEAPGSCQNESKIMTALSATSEKETARILVVEDEAVVALDLEQVLEAEGYATRVATTGAEAITAARAQQPALVLMDVRLRGGMDGIDAARAIRQFSDVPVIFLTAFEDGPTIQRAADVEAYGYLVKPCHERALHGAIQVAICKHAKDAALRETMLAQATRDPLTGLFNRRYLDETFRREVAHANRSEAPLSVVLMDVDHFKRFNDVHGHAAGDAVLHEVANTLKKTFRISDVVCRYGGEEFLAASRARSERQTRSGARSRGVLSRIRAARSAPSRSRRVSPGIPCTGSPQNRWLRLLMSRSTAPRGRAAIESWRQGASSSSNLPPEPHR